MPIDEETAERRLPQLLLWFAKIRAAVEPEVGAVKLRGGDDFGFMSLCFLSKQIDHAYSLERLSPLKDTVLVSRCMFEGLSQLIWAAQDMKNRYQVSPCHLYDLGALRPDPRDEVWFRRSCERCGG